MIFDSTLTFDKQINAAVKTSFFQCQGLARVKQFLCFRHREGYPFFFLFMLAIVTLFIQVSVWHTQATTYPPYRLPYTGRPVSFHCLFCFFKALDGLVPPYLSDLLTLHTPTTSLRSAERTLLAVPRSRSFTVAAPKLRSKLAFNRTSTKPALKSFNINWLLTQSSKYFHSFSFLLMFCHFVSVFLRNFIFVFILFFELCSTLVKRCWSKLALT